MKKLSILFGLSLITILASCSKEEPCIDESKINLTAACTMEWNPVCGCDGKTYGNDCQATNAGLLSWTEGDCDK